MSNYPEHMVAPMRQELVEQGFRQLMTPAQVDEALQQPGTTLLLVNSVCGCAAAGARPGVIQLTATLRSHAQYDVAYPALDLVLTNAQEHTLARRIFAPREYLTKARDPALGIPPNAEVTLQLDLDTGDLGASGFRLDLLPAPS